MLRICNQISWLEIVFKKCLKNMEHWDLTIFFFFFLKCPIKLFRLKDFKKFPTFNRSGSEWTECSFLRRVGVFGSTAIPSFSFSCLYSVNVEFPWVSKHVIGLKKCKKKFSLPFLWQFFCCKIFTEEKYKECKGKKVILNKLYCFELERSQLSWIVLTRWRWLDRSRRGQNWQS